MNKKEFNKIFKNYHNFFTYDNSIKNNILLIDRGRPISIFKSVIISLILLKKKKSNLTILSSYKKSSWQYSAYQSFGTFRYICIRDFFYLIRNLNYLILSIYEVIHCYFKWKNDLFDFINNFSINNIKIGHLIYDEYIKDNNKYILFNNFNLSFLWFLYKKVFLFHKIQRVIQDNNIKVLICCSIDYATYASLAARIAIKKKIPVLHIDGQFHIMRKEEDLDQSTFKLKDREIKLFFKKRKKINFKSFIKKRFSGKLRTVMAGYKDLKNDNVNKKKEINRNNFINLYAKKQKIKKIALFAPHAFTDANHGIGKKFVFNGYYDQLINTIDFIANHKDDNILWVVNPHPTSKEYGELGQVDEVIQKYNKKNIIILPKNIKTISAIKFSDLIITGRGTIGIEAASLGKKVIIAGYAIYEKLGFTIEPKNKAQYFKSLIDIKNFNKQSEKNTKKALKYLYYFENHNSHGLPHNPIDEYYFHNKGNTITLNNFLDQRKILNNNYFKKINLILGKYLN